MVIALGSEFASLETWKLPPPLPSPALQQRCLAFSIKYGCKASGKGSRKPQKKSARVVLFLWTPYSYVMLIFYQLLHFSNSRHCTVARMQVELFQISKQLRKGTWKGTRSLSLTTPTTKKWLADSAGQFTPLTHRYQHLNAKFAASPVHYVKYYIVDFYIS